MKMISDFFDIHGFFLHASAIVIQGKVLLLLGHSGAGKTTLTNLFSEEYEILVDDLAFIQCRKDGVWCVFNGFKINNVSDTYTQPFYPLYTVVRIFASKKTEVLPILQTKTCEYLMDAVFEIDINRDSRNTDFECKWFAFSAQIARHYAGWMFRFSLNLSDILYALGKQDLLSSFRENDYIKGEGVYEKET